MAYVDIKPIPIRERAAIISVGAAQIDVSDQGLVLIDAEHGRTHVPVAGLACLMLEPGTRISHAAITLAAKVNCLIVWCGEAFQDCQCEADQEPGPCEYCDGRGAVNSEETDQP